jgi:arylsulfatase A-like enzyme
VPAVVRAASGLALAAAAGLVLSCTADVAPRPNVLVLVLDTVRADRCSFLGYARPTTPNLDAFARDAVTFEDAWSPASWTAPAHAALFTGTNPHHLDLFRGSDTNLVGGQTLAERLTALGWESGAFSANPWVGPEVGLTRGFGVVRHFLPNGTTFTDSAVVVSAAIEWMRSCVTAERGAPFLAYVNLMDAHAPYDPPEASRRGFVSAETPFRVVDTASRLGTLDDLLPSSLDGTPLPPGVEKTVSDLYDASIATADAQAGRLLQELDRLGVAGNTVVVVASDHGEGLGDHGWREHGLRLHRELLRVPLIVRSPGRLDGGRRVRGTVELADVVPTVLASCGLQPPPSGDGSDLAAPPPPARIVFATDRAYAGWPMLAARKLPEPWRRQLETVRRSAYDGRHHLILDDRGGLELYDTVTDPAELRNVAADAPDVVTRLRAALRTEFGDR